MTDGDALALAAGDAADLFVTDDGVGGAHEAEIGDDGVHSGVLLGEGRARSEAKLRAEEEGLSDGGEGEKGVLLLNVGAHACHLRGIFEALAVRVHGPGDGISGPWRDGGRRNR